MNILLKSAKILDEHNKGLHGKVRDIWIKNGIIEKIGVSVKTDSPVSGSVIVSVSVVVVSAVTWFVVVTVSLVVNISRVSGSRTFSVILISPVFGFLLIYFVSGVRLLENKGDKKWGNNPDYKKYKKNTPVFFPKILKWAFCLKIGINLLLNFRYI